MHPTDKAARIAGALYLALAITAPFHLIYIPRALIVTGNATATANNSAKANVGQKKKTYMTPTANPMRRPVDGSRPPIMRAARPCMPPATPREVSHRTVDTSQPPSHAKSRLGPAPISK